MYPQLAQLPANTSEPLRSYSAASMNNWVPWSQVNALALLAHAHEKLTLDLKQSYDLNASDIKYEIAKDLAAFANVLGGTVLIGAIEGRDAAGRRHGRASAFASVASPVDIMRVAADAAASICRPAVQVAPEEIRLTPDEARLVTSRDEGEVTLLALNVSAAIAAPIGVRCAGDADAYKFPFRSLERTVWMKPEDLVLHMNSHERRMLLLLSRVGPNEILRIWDSPEFSLGPRMRAFHVESVDPASLTVKVRTVTAGDYPFVNIPLTFVTAMWRDADGMWNVTINGSVARDGHAPAFAP